MKPEVDDGQKVARPDVVRVILQEGGPGLRGGFGRANACEVFLNGAFGNGETEFEQFAVNAFGSPQPILLRHPLDQRDGSRRESGTATAVARFELPEETESLTMPAQEGVRFDDEERILPVFDATGEEDEPEPIGWREDGLFNLTVKDDKLLTKQSILGEEVGPTAGEVCGRAENDRMAGGLGEMQEGSVNGRNQTHHSSDEQMQKGRHVG